MSSTDAHVGLFDILLLGLGGSVLAVVFLWLEIRGRRRISRNGVGILTILFSVAAAVLWAEHRPLGMVVPFLILTGTCLLASVTYSATVKRSAQRLLSPRVVWGAVLAICPVFSTAYAFHWLRPADNLTLCDLSLCCHAKLKGIRALTDRGRKIELFTFAESTSASCLENLMLGNDQWSQHVIRVADPSVTCNCHGWVFTGGRFGIASSNVDCILADNGYTVVPDAAEGDLIVYRDGDGQVLHTGLVRLAGADGLLLVESKWGPMGRFVHPPEAQPYSHTFAFYRSRRRGHELRLEPAHTAPLQELH
jgi:hypothetical protein